jgi:6-pyruvoyltetrahydropterin/6-carboxytetrahydropterin synthase
MIIKKTFHFDAAHFLENYDGPCKNLHGHTFLLTIALQGKVDDHTGMVLDFRKLKAIVKQEILCKVDHVCLNEVLDFNPTCENMVKWIYEKLNTKLNIHSIELKEGLGGSARYPQN